MWFTQDRLHPHIISSPLLLYHSSKWRDTNCNNPATLPLHSLTVSLTQSHRLFFNATIQYTTILQSFPFVGELPWEDTTSHPIPWVRKPLANKHHTKFFWGASPSNPLSWGRFPRTHVGGSFAARQPLGDCWSSHQTLGWLYNKTWAQTWLNNVILKYGISCSITNKGEEGCGEARVG